MAKYELDERNTEEIVNAFLTPAPKGAKFKDFMASDEEPVIKFKFLKTVEFESEVTKQILERLEHD